MTWICAPTVIVKRLTTNQRKFRTRSAAYGSCRVSRACMPPECIKRSKGSESFEIQTTLTPLLFGRQLPGGADRGRERAADLLGLRKVRGDDRTYAGDELLQLGMTRRGEEQVVDLREEDALVLHF